MLKAVIFDVDGVLVQSENVHVHAVQTVFRGIYGLELGPQDQKRIVARHESDYMPELIKLHGLDPAKQAQLQEDFKRTYAELWEKEVELMPDAAAVIAALRQKNIKLSLASNASRPTLQRFIDRFGFGGIFDPITSGEEVLKKKPDPRIYLVAKSKLPDFPAEEILVVEDSGIGVQAAKAAGLPVAAVPNEYTAYQDFTGADHIFKSLREILNLF